MLQKFFTFLAIFSNEECRLTLHEKNYHCSVQFNSAVIFVLTQCSQLNVHNSRFKTQYSQLNIQNSKFTIQCSQLNVHNEMSQLMFTTQVHNSCSHFMFTTFVYNFCSQLLFWVLFTASSSTYMFTTLVNNFFHNFFLELFSQLMFTTYQTILIHNFCSQFKIRPSTSLAEWCTSAKPPDPATADWVNSPS